MFWGSPNESFSLYYSLCQSASILPARRLSMTKGVKVDIDGACRNVNKAPEDFNFDVIFEVDIGKNVANIARKRGMHYNCN
jgi:hypothetical protein